MDLLFLRAMPFFTIGMKTFFNYVKDSIGEVKFIKWPTREQTTWFTIAVLVITFIVAYYLGALDVLFAKLLKLVI